MTDKEENIKSRLKLLIDNIDEFGHKFVTYKAESMKSLLKDTLEYINNKEQECEELKGRLNTICFDPRTNNNRCISYNRMAEDYEKDLKKINKYKKALEEIKSLCKNEACAPCKELEENDHCDECHDKIILDSINKTKEENQCEQ